MERLWSLFSTSRRSPPPCGHPEAIGIPNGSQIHQPQPDPHHRRGQSDPRVS